ncbi:MAG: hypothetical protein COV52_01815 [Gammaproteobacteria bacterium CG11_big_fil_rev_8_21_14_0_20_46_22]|nr:MAG: hypothetical protein COW05_05710 [Gammaproteobacteria bacterium CG12_big_fil_rev_8_21_14_0_65_46_12]PIR11851.1 MAG: hypothetical protein COV52_01815 [Gammaproteobacteria bacterium CG11_big_fil_rev_8_21_14_0_20_46_22]
MSVNTTKGIVKQLAVQEQAAQPAGKLQELLREQRIAKQRYMESLSEYREAKEELDEINRAIKEEAALNSDPSINLKPAKSRVIIDSADNVPGNYYRLFTHRIPDVHKIAQALEAGVEIPGARLEDSNTVELNAKKKFADDECSKTFSHNN